MITITATQNRVIFSGHAGMDAPGRDVCCAAASALCEVLRQAYGGESEPGRAEIPVTGERATLLAVMAALRELTLVYPAYIRISG